MAAVRGFRERPYGITVQQEAFARRAIMPLVYALSWSSQGLDSVSGLGGGGFVGRVGRVFEFIASSAEGSEWAQDGAELGPCWIPRLRNGRLMSSAEALPGHQGCAGLTGRVVGEHERKCSDLSAPQRVQR